MKSKGNANHYRGSLSLFEVSVDIIETPFYCVLNRIVSRIVICFPRCTILWHNPYRSSLSIWLPTITRHSKKHSVVPRKLERILDVTMVASYSGVEDADL